MVQNSKIARPHAADSETTLGFHSVTTCVLAVMNIGLSVCSLCVSSFAIHISIVLSE